ncbi:hypothetical protein F4782DRAFT_528643 [Xylaria castorea]|nr:hypothetical protein F4782DRAFT_528643 [Xylaria castorea]
MSTLKTSASQSSIQSTASHSSIESIDSFIETFFEKLKVADDKTYTDWFQTLKMDDGKSLLDQRKELSHENKKRPSNDLGFSSPWTDDMLEDYNIYKEQSDELANKKKEFETAKTNLKQYKKRRRTNPEKLRELINDSLTKADAWCDAGVAGCKKRLDFMVKYKNVFNKHSTAGHVQQAQDNLKSATSAWTEAKTFQTQLEQLKQPEQLEQLEQLS